MMDVRLTLDFACCHCESPVSATVQCRGKWPWNDPSRPRMGVVIPCPDCQRVCRVAFDPGGTVHAVEPYREPRHSLAPSYN